MIIPDTDILIWLLRGDENTKNRFIELDAESGGKMLITPIQISEIHAGLRPPEELETELFLDAFFCITIGKDEGKLSGEFLRQYHKPHGVTLADSLIAACVKIHGCRLWTLNRKHYPMLSDSDFVLQ